MVTYPFRFQYSEKVEDFFIRNNIFLSMPENIKGVYKFGEQLVLQRPVMIEPYSVMAKKTFSSLGSFSFTQSGLSMPHSVGRYCSISFNVKLMRGDHPLHHISTHLFTYRKYYEKHLLRDFQSAPATVPAREVRGPVKVGNDVWIGQDVLIRNGITIGDGAVVAAGSVVVKDVPPYAIVGGNPAKVIRYRFDEDLIEILSKLKWWEYHCKDFSGLPVDDPRAFAEGLMERIERNEISKYPSQRLDLAAEIEKVSI
ncbi:CatB-related O-acetyltransferase [Thioclava sp. GXIMD2076]|uniref:CatB-related O-acetyltransferase n=1 Tax=Thioclava sp. GXIMD2076 TaxID=3131931 RepID=UPI0030D339D2